MNKNSLHLISGMCGMLLVFAGCETKKPAETNPPRVFTPAREPVYRNNPPDSTEMRFPEPEPQPEAIKEIAKPDLKNLEKITPNQEARRMLTRDAGKAFRMPLEEFGKYMQTRVPYYKNKGNLTFENDIVQIEITETDMHIKTIKGSLHIPMK